MFLGLYYQILLLHAHLVQQCDFRMPFTEGIGHGQHPRTKQCCIQCASLYFKSHLCWFPGEESIVQKCSKSWRLFPMVMALLFGGLANVTCTDVIRLCQLAFRPPVAPGIVYSTSTCLASGMVCPLSLFERLTFIFELETVH